MKIYLKCNVYGKEINALTFLWFVIFRNFIRLSYIFIYKEKRPYLMMKIQPLNDLFMDLYVLKDLFYLSFSMSAFSFASTSRSPREVPATTLLIAGASFCLRAAL